MNPQLESVIVEMEKAVRGKRAVIEHMLCALLAGGHILLDDMPANEQIDCRQLDGHHHIQVTLPEGESE